MLTTQFSQCMSRRETRYAFRLPGRMLKAHLRNSTLLVCLSFIGVATTHPRREHHSAAHVSSAEIQASLELSGMHPPGDHSGGVYPSHRGEHEGPCTCLMICDVSYLSFDIDVDQTLLPVQPQVLLPQPSKSTNDELYLVPPDFVLPFADGPPQAF